MRSFHLEKTTKDLAPLSFTFAVISILGFPFFPLISIVLLTTSVMAVIVGLMSLSSPKKVQAIAAIIIGTVFFIIYGMLYIQLMNMG